SDRLAGVLTQLERSFGVINHKAGMHFDRNLLNPVTLCERSGLSPIRDNNLAPLPLQNLRIVWRSCRCYPFWIYRCRRITGATGENVDHGNFKLLGQTNRAFEGNVVFTRDFGTWMNRVAVARQRANE